MSDVLNYARKGSVAVLRIQNPPVNALSHAVRLALMDGISRAEKEEGVRAVVLVGAGRTFIAGADIKEFGKTPLEPHLPDVCNRLEQSPLLSVASMHGVSLGGGLEVALSAHYRVAQPDARVGLPEVHLGLIPGAGGTQRLPRLTGVDAAINAITSGRHIQAPEALEMSIIDRIADDDPEEAGLKYAEELIAQNAPRRPVRDMAVPQPVHWDDTYDAVLKSARGQIAPAVAVRAVQASVERSFDDGLQEERNLFWQLMETDQRQGMIHTFFAQRSVGNLPELKEVSRRGINSIGVVGGGTMGVGIATAFILTGLPVTLIERTEEACTRARADIVQNLEGAARRGKITSENAKEAINSSLVVSTQFAELEDVDLVVEAVFEDMAAKRAVFELLDENCAPGTILATNTSYLDVNEIADATSRPQDVIGLHFFSPAHVMKLLEVVVPDRTSPDIVATCFDLGKRLGKISVRSGVCEGFIGNRILTAYRTVADHLVLDGATPYEVDAAMEAFGFPLGPFAVTDLAGLDISWEMRKRRAPKRHANERVGLYADRLCEAGHFGQKTGIGFYLYQEDRRAKKPNPEVMQLIKEERSALGLQERAFSADDIQRRVLVAMVNEGAKILAEGIARRPLDVDMVLVFGYGFPKYWGGPMKWADLVGAENVAANCRDYAKEDPHFWAPAKLLEEIAGSDQAFDDLNA